MSGGRIYLHHILDAITQVEEFAAVGRDRFFTERHWQGSVIYQLLIMGEATKKLSMALRDRHLEVAWRSMAGLRDVLIHNYRDVDLDVVWAAVQEDLTGVKRGVEAIIAEEPPG